MGFFSKLFGLEEKEENKFEEMLQSEIYINSGYVAQKINNSYALKHIKSGLYVDLVHNCYKWGYGSKFTHSILGSKEDVVKAFNYICPIIEEMNIQKTFN